MDKTVSNYIIEIGKQVFSEALFKTAYSWFNEVVQYLKEEIRKDQERQDD